jgi:hypothetical protein
MKKILYSIIILFYFIGNINAQLKIVPLEYNPKIEEYKTKEHKLINQRSSTDTLEVPFIEDFAKFDIYPDSRLWLDSEVYINNNFVDTPIFRGVATFDCLNKDGIMHENTSVYTFVSDTLTSKPINLQYNKTDSVYFSFFYQPQGTAYDPPEYKDSLVLEFKSPLTTQWVSVWHKNGDFKYPLKQKLISITDSVFLVKGFQFRFKNYASVSSDNRSSNGDYWNIDMIRLDTGRTAQDTLVADVGFATTPVSFLKDYYSMPWKHFNISMDAKSNSATYRNYGPTPIGIAAIDLYVEPIGWTQYLHKDLGSYDISAYSLDFLNVTYNSTVFDPVYFNQSFNDSAEYILKTVLHINQVVGEDFTWNDTTYFSQKFYNYYAYDDGIPEAGIGIDGENSAGSEISIQFHSLIPDTLQAVRFWFNRTNENINKDLAFDLIIRKYEDGLPGDTLYTETDLFSNYNFGLDNYATYVLKNPIIVEDTFCVGFLQNHEEYMNLGFDKNTDASENTFYKIGGFWSQNYNQGSIMIRPVLGKKLPISVKEINTISNMISVFPNPSNNYIQIELNSSENIKINNIQIIDISGRVLNQFNNNKIGDNYRINTSLYPNGLYFIKISTNKGLVNKKIIVNH